MNFRTPDLTISKRHRCTAITGMCFVSKNRVLWWENLLSNSEKAKGVGPDCSIVIPTCNRPAQLADCLAAVANQDMPRHTYEVLVVDDGSSLSLEPTLEQVRCRLDIRLIRQDNSGPAAARNNGARLARGRFIAFLDDDCLPDKLWLPTLLKAAAPNPGVLAGGRIINGLPDNIYATAKELILDLAYAYYNEATDRCRFLASNNMLMRTADLMDVGGFNAAFRAAEDRDFCDRWLLSGRRIIQVPEAAVVHRHSLNLSAFWHLYMDYGCGAWQFNKAFKGRHHGRSTIDLRFYQGLLQRIPGRISQWPASQAIRILMLLFVWQFANAIGFFMTGIR
jgi:GT2 family glycosyltransferase